MQIINSNPKKLPKPISIATTPNGRVIAKLGNFNYVLVHTGERELNKWSNSIQKLRTEMDFLIKLGWKPEELQIIETRIQ